MSTARGDWGVFSVGRHNPPSDDGEACAGEWLCVQGLRGAGQKTPRLFYPPMYLLSGVSHFGPFSESI